MITLLKLPKIQLNEKASNQSEKCDKQKKKPPWIPAAVIYTDYGKRNQSSEAETNKLLTICHPSKKASETAEFRSSPF